MNKKKRIGIISTITVLLLTSMIGLSACSKKENTEPTTRNNEAESSTTFNSTSKRILLKSTSEYKCNLKLKTVNISQTFIAELYQIWRYEQ